VSTIAPPTTTEAASIPYAVTTPPEQVADGYDARPRSAPNVGLSPARQDGERELVDLIYSALRRDREVTRYLSMRGVDLGVVWTLVRGGRPS